MDFPMRELLAIGLFAGAIALAGSYLLLVASLERRRGQRRRQRQDELRRFGA